MKQILTFIFFIATAPIVFSQGADECNIKYNLFKGEYKAKKYDEAFTNWMWCMDNCPKLSVNIYKYGVVIAKHKFKNASAAEKETAKELVKRVYMQRLDHFPADKPKVFSDMATFMAANGASEEKVFELLQQAFEIDPTAMSGKNILRYFDGVMSRNKDTDPQLVFDTYDEVIEGVELKRNSYFKKVDAINAKDSLTLSAKDKKNRKIYQQNLKALMQIESGLDSRLSSISTCENLIPLNKKNFDAHKADPVWLRRAVSRMYNKECTDDPFYDTLVEAYVKADPSPQASVFYAGILMKNGETTKANEYFKQAVEQEPNPYKKSGYLLKVAQNQMKKGRKSEARSYCYEALKYAPSNGRAYLLIASMYASSANSCGTDVVSKRMVYVAAVNKAVKAKSVDPSVSGIANKYIKAYSANMPSKKDLFVAGIPSGSSHKIGCWINETVRVP
ncbi:tetratricopeptide repeat protein [Lutibacter holmesii]|uniref:Tetratricopeptide repeat protein n=1 Tax=Lutibacter holmesii TaxID=1137985 RepID=A0ABW3WQC7_9FLAO